MAKKSKEVETKKQKKNKEVETKKKKHKVSKEVEVKVKKTKKEKLSDDVGVDMSALYADILDEVWKRQGTDDGLSSDMTPMSTGMLAYDVILGGGIRPAWYTFYGPEQSAKTTGALTTLAASIKAGIPLIHFSDYEGSTKNSISYVQNIFKGAGIKQNTNEVFGKRDPDSGKWIIRPIVGYSASTKGEKFFDRLADYLRTLPDKKKIGRNWWLVFEDTKANKMKYSDLSTPSMAKKYGPGIYLKCDNAELQGIFLTDSYPAMNPTDNDNEEANKSLALQARMFSKHLPRVKGRLAQKMVAVLGTNQLRANPMGYPPEIEPGGQALKFNSDARIKQVPRAIGGVPTTPKPKPSKEDPSVQSEPSVQFDGSDIYRYVAIKAEKNKMWTPKRQAWMRIWVEDGNGEARGLDPVYDTYWYLWVTGQANGSKSNAINFNLEGLGEGKKTISWIQFKLWVLGNKEAKTGISERLGYKPMDIRKFCFSQMANGTGEALYIKRKMKKAKAKSEGGSDDDE